MIQMGHQNHRYSFFKNAASAAEQHRGQKQMEGRILTRCTLLDSVGSFKNFQLLFQQALERTGFLLIGSLGLSFHLKAKRRMSADLGLMF